VLGQLSEHRIPVLATIICGPHQATAKYQGGVRTMYRLLADDGAYGERRNQLTHPAYA
jgi:hypothetical protein